MSIPIIKSLPRRKVSWEEAMSYHLRHAPVEEQTELRRGRTMRALGFARKFQQLRLFAMFTGKFNDYERAGFGVGREVQAAGRAACSGECELCVHSYIGSETESDPRVVFIKPDCAKEDCPEDGLRAVRDLYEDMPDQALRDIAEFENCAVADIQRGAYPSIHRRDPASALRPPKGPSE